MELYLRVVASSLAVCLFTANVVIERIMVTFKSRTARIIQWIAGNERVWNITTAIDNQFVFSPTSRDNYFQHFQFVHEFFRNWIPVDYTVHVECNFLCSDNNHLVFRISINFSLLSSSGDPVRAWSRDHPQNLFERWGSKVPSLPVSQIYYVKVGGLCCCHLPQGVLELIRKI